MSDVLTRTDASTSPAPAVPAPSTPWPAHLERRRPGRRNDISPELIALMRKPTEQARRAVALYDAPNFVLPPAPAHRARFSPHQVIRVLTAAGTCAVVWAAAFRGMMMLWG